MPGAREVHHGPEPSVPSPRGLVESSRRAVLDEVRTLFTQ
jgi:hypothetical protein